MLSSHLEKFQDVDLFFTATFRNLPHFPGLLFASTDSQHPFPCLLISQETATIWAEAWSVKRSFGKWGVKKEVQHFESFLVKTVHGGNVAKVWCACICMQIHIHIHMHIYICIYLYLYLYVYLYDPICICKHSKCMCTLFTHILAYTLDILYTYASAALLTLLISQVQRSESEWLHIRRTSGLTSWYGEQHEYICLYTHKIPWIAVF